MDIILKNCNNIGAGNVKIEEGRLNIKYAINGTGKSTIAKAMEAFINNDEDKKNMLIPFKFLENPDGNMPEVIGYENISKVAIFNEEYINEHIYQPDELIKNSFEIFVKTPDYDKHMKEIENLLKEVNITFQKHPELDSLIQAFGEFIDGFGKARSGYSAAGSIGKGLAKGNKIDNIPEGLEVYEPYLKSPNNVKWLKWQMEGKEFFDIADKCPYCSGSVSETKETILKISDEYDPKSVEQLNKMITIFKNLTPFFDEITKEKINEFMMNISGMTEIHKKYLLEIKEQVAGILSQLLGLKQMGFHSLKSKDKIADEIRKYKIDLNLFSHLDSKLSREKVDIINKTLDIVLDKAGKLQGEIEQQKILIRRTIEMYSEEINEFLHFAGYRYVVSIEENQDHSDYRLVLRHIDATLNVQAVEQHLSYGERNAFALVLFMYNVLRDNPELVILDDPISSFDGNKKFAIINKLFMGKHSLKNRTVLLLTHEFGTVIDIIHTMPHNFSPSPKASFVTTKNGVLVEKEIKKENIKPFALIAKENIKTDIDSLNKWVYLRRLFEISDSNEMEWQLLSNLFHKRREPIISRKDEKRLMTNEEIQHSSDVIKEYIPEFDYNTEFEKTQNMTMLKQLYVKSRSNYEKLIIYRIMFNKNNDNLIIKKFVNEAFHVENDYLVQLNPCEYDTVPQYVIDECDKDIQAYFTSQN